MIIDCNKRVLGHLKDLLIVTIIGNFVTFLFVRQVNDIAGFILWASGYSLLIGGFLWKGNELVSHFVHKRFDMNKYPAKSLKWSLISMFFYTIIAIFTVNYFWYVIFMEKNISYLYTGSGLITSIVEFGITIVIASVIYSIGFFKSWREAAVNEERLKKESLAHQYKALKNQVNPHFLFNSLNTLSSLVYKNQDMAAKFIKQLSEVYRYVIEQKDNEVVSVKTEVEFVKKYLYLQQIRHSKNLQYEITLNDCSDKFIIPISLQMLVENSIKHNIVSEENPLEIKIYNDENYLIVRNNLQKKTAIADSGGIGLDNIKSRYEHLTDKPFIIEEDTSYFIVKIPLLKYIYS